MPHSPLADLYSQFGAAQHGHSAFAAGYGAQGK